MQVRCSPFVYVKCFEDLRICIQDAVDAGPELDDWEAVHARSIVQRSGDHADATQEMFRRRQAEKEKKEKEGIQTRTLHGASGGFQAGAADPDQLGETYPGGQLRGTWSRRKQIAHGKRLREEKGRNHGRPGFPQVIRARPRRETWQR